MTRVFLLKPGSILRDESGAILDARSSVTLITSGSKKIIVDTGLKGEDKQIINALAQKGLRPEDIDILVNTHNHPDHPDHTGNNHLFSRAKLLHPCEGETLAPGVRAIETPGHTIDSISVVVSARSRSGRGETVIVVAGDALPTLGNYLKDVPPALHVDRDMAISSMARIIGIANIVVPGHDLPFSISERKYVEL